MLSTYIQPNKLTVTVTSLKHGDKIDICVDNGNSVNFFNSVWVLFIYGGNCYSGEIKSLQSRECEVSVTHPSGKYWKLPNQEDNIYYLKNNLLKNITSPQIVHKDISCLKNCNNYVAYLLSLLEIVWWSLRWQLKNIYIQQKHLFYFKIPNEQASFQMRTSVSEYLYVLHILLTSPKGEN